MAKYRYLAEWITERAVDEHGDHDPYKDKTAVQDFAPTPGFDRDDPNNGHDPAMVEAAKYGCARNCYGSECFVNVQEWAFDEALYDDTGRKVYQWWDVERYLCADGAIIERVD